MAHLQEAMQTMEAADAAALEAKAARSVMEGEPAADEPQVVPPQSTEPVWRDGDPDVSDWVIYQPRRGMIRRGRNRVAALVVHRHEHARLLDLAIFYEAGDTLDDQRVPEAIGDERGWLVKGNAPRAVSHAPYEIIKLRREVDDLRGLVLGGYERPPASVLAMLDAVDERVDRLERAKPKAKRKYVRKAKAPAEAPKAE